MSRALTLLLALATLLCAAGVQRKPQKPKPPRIEVVQISVQRQPDGVINIDGRVRNTGERPAQHLALVFHFQASGGETVTTQRGTLDEDVLEPGAEADFHWQLKDHARAVQVRIDAQDSGWRELDVQKPGPYTVE